MRIAIVMADAIALSEMVNMIGLMGHETVFAIRRGDQALSLLHEQVCDALIIDITLSGLDGLGVIKHLRESPPLVMPAAILLSPAAMKIRASGACRSLLKPIDPNALREALESIAPMDRLAPIHCDPDRILDLLQSLGFRRRMRGTRHLMRCIELSARDGRLLQALTKTLYPLAAQACDTTADRLAHAMRRAIETAWSHGDIEQQHRMFGYTIDEQRGRPTAGMLIARIAQQIRTKEAEVDL